MIAFHNPSDQTNHSSSVVRLRISLLCGADARSFRVALELPMFPIRSTRLSQQAGLLRIVLRPHASPSSLLPLPPASAVRSWSSSSLNGLSNGGLKSNCKPTTAQQRGQQTRWNTSYDRRPEIAPKLTVGQILRRALRFSGLFRGQTLRKMFQDSPEETVLALLL